MSLTTYEMQVNRLLAERQLAILQAKAEQQSQQTLTARIEHILQAQKLVQAAAQAVQQSAHGQIAHIVSRCLTTVFDEPYEFQIKFEQKRGKTEARLVFIRDGMEIDPVGAAGGGVIDVAAFALRLAALLLTRPKPRKLLVLDEPFRFVSHDYRGRVRELLQALAQELGVQIVQVTHSKELVTGKVVEL